MAFRTMASYATFIFSSYRLTEDDTYSVYVGCGVDGAFDEYVLCTSFTVTSTGTLQQEQHGM